MPQTFDLLLRGATIVNQDGIGARDIGVIQKKVAAVPPGEWAEDACEFSVS